MGGTFGRQRVSLMYGIHIENIFKRYDFMLNFMVRIRLFNSGYHLAMLRI